MTKYYVIILLLSLFSVWPFFKDGYIKSHDGEWMLIRFTAFHQSLSEGHFPVRITKRLNNNYGYPVLNFLYPGPFYLAEIPKILGLSFITSIKLVFVTTTIGSALLMFWALSKKFTYPASFAGSIVYLFIPYRFVDIYVRGSLGENMAFFIAPIALGSIFSISKGSKIFLPILALSTALLLISHNVIAALFLPIITATSGILLPKRLFLHAMAYIFLGIAISAFFTLPAILDLKHVRLPQTTIANTTEHLVNLSKIIVPSWGYGPNPNINDGLSPQLGIVPIFVFFASIMLLLKTKKKDPIILFLITIFLVSTLLMLNLSKPIWTIVPFIDMVQFPWRLLSIIVLSSAILSAFIVDKLKSRWILAAVIVISLGTTITYAKPIGYSYLPDSYYSTNEDTTTVKSEYLPIWVVQQSDKKAGSFVETNPNLKIVQEELHGLSYKAIIDAGIDTQLTYNTIYFPGFKAKVDSKNKEIKYDNPLGLITINLPKGTHKVIINYSKTTAHLVSELISIFALLLTLILFYKIWQKSSF